MRRRDAGSVLFLLVAGVALTLGPSATYGQARKGKSATAIGAGLIHTCALTSTGAVLCLGYNANHELGDWPLIYRTTPVQISGLTGDVTAIAVGSRHGCALVSAGGLKCWGGNKYGQLGDGTTVNRAVPVAVPGLSSGVTAVAARDHTCALTSSGGVKCWGSNSTGQLGDGTTENRSMPVDVSGLGGEAKAIAAGYSHTCAVTSSGGVKCWGDNAFGELGDGTTTDRSTPVDVSGLSDGIVEVAAGGLHSCALTRAGSVKCWGWNDFGQLGDGTRKERHTPVPVSGLKGGVVAISAGLDHTCALGSTGAVACWGSDYYGELGDGANTYRSRPVAVFGLSHGVTAITAGGLHSCAVTRAGSVKCWGRNIDGELGDGTEVDRRRPVGVVGFGPPQARLVVLSRSVHVTRKRVAAVRLGCGKAARCRGRLSLSESSRLLGRRRFSIAPGRRAAVEVELTGRGFQLLLRAKRLRTRAWVTYTQLDATTSASSRTVLLLPPR